MSESCGSNAFPNAEVEKRKTNKKHTVDVEDEVLSTNQKPYKVIIQFSTWFCFSC
jgi:hypothetical protein